MSKRLIYKIIGRVAMGNDVLKAQGVGEAQKLLLQAAELVKGISQSIDLGTKAESESGSGKRFLSSVPVEKGLS